MDENLPPSSPALPMSPPQALSQSPPWGFLGQSDTSADCTAHLSRLGRRDQALGKALKVAPLARTQTHVSAPRVEAGRKQRRRLEGVLMVRRPTSNFLLSHNQR